MKKRASWALGLCALLGILGAAEPASAQCCAGHTLTTSCTTAPTKSRWCIANDAPNGFGTATLPEVFCSWGDQVVTTLENVFNIQAPSIFEFDLDDLREQRTEQLHGGTAHGGAQTPTDCGTFGNSVTLDAFTGNAYGANYLGTSLHEAINQWTGLASGGWPTDWWVTTSAFPNLMDFHIMNSIGTTNMDNNLLVGTAQKKRFYPGGDSADPRVVALDTIYAMMPSGNGLAGFSQVFSMVKGDGMSWGSLGTNPNQKLSEYVLAYIALAVGQQGSQVLPTAKGPSANMGGNICNGFQDGNMDPTYVCTEADIDAIANAHCAIAANGKPAADLTSFQKGDYASVKMGPCGSSCPSECGCEMSTMNCVAPWVAMNGGGSGSDAGGDSGNGSSSGGGNGSSSGGSSGGGVAPPDASVPGGSSSSSGGGLGGSPDGGGEGDAPTIPSASSGCGCSSVGEERKSPLSALTLSALAALAFVRLRRRR